MPNTASHDTLDDAAFEAQLSNFEGPGQTAAGEAQQTNDRFDPLNVAFPFANDEPIAGSPRNPPEFHPMHADAEARQTHARDELRMRDRVAHGSEASAFAVAVAVVIGLAAGATAATYVFYDRAAPIIAAWSRP